MAFQEPPGDADFTAAVNDFITFANANLADIGLVAADMTPLTTIFPDWEAGYAEHITKQAAAEAATRLYPINHLGSQIKMQASRTMPM